MICARCDKPIRPGEPRESYDVLRPTGPGLTLTVHAHLCKRPPSQTAPTTPFGRLSRRSG